ncbi:MAG: DUF3488 domain-containing protein, partial [Phycisphaerae bacterium]|nr:DUF3488 domain-containing protein [Phycisphaerae bacterium]
MPLRSFSTAEIILTQRSRLERPLLVMVWLSTAAFSLAERNFFFVSAATLAVAVNLLASRKDREIYVRRLFVNLGVLLATGIFAIEALGDEWLTIAVGHYLILIQLCKLFERKTNRDYAQMIVLSLLVMVTVTLICPELWFAAVLIAYLALVCYTMMVLTLKRGLDAAAEASLPSESKSLEPQHIAWNVARNWPGRALRKRLTVVMLATLITGAVVFIVAPRASSVADAALGRRPGIAITGFRETVRLGETNRIYLSDAVVMRVKTHNLAEGEPLPQSIAYLRGLTYSAYADSRWSRWLA